MSQANIHSLSSKDLGAELKLEETIHSSGSRELADVEVEFVEALAVLGDGMWPMVESRRRD